MLSKSWETGEEAEAARTLYDAGDPLLHLFHAPQWGLLTKRGV